MRRCVFPLKSFTFFPSSRSLWTTPDINDDFDHAHWGATKGGGAPSYLAHLQTKIQKQKLDDTLREKLAEQRAKKAATETSSSTKGVDTEASSSTTGVAATYDDNKTSRFRYSHCCRTSGGIVVVAGHPDWGFLCSRVS